jgi:Ras-related GTP-binding protein C/D
MDYTVYHSCAVTAALCTRSGKTSMQKVVFHKLSPHDTLFIDESPDLEVKYVCNNQFVQFQIWDFPGDYDLNGE